MPGKQALANAPYDWPEQLCSGSLNVSITGYPADFTSRRIKNSTTSLRIAGFLPAGQMTIPHAAMSNNILAPTPFMPLGNRTGMARNIRCERAERSVLGSSPLQFQTMVIELVAEFRSQQTE